MNEQEKGSKLVSQSIKQSHQPVPLYFLIIPTEKTSIISLSFIVSRTLCKIVSKRGLQLQVGNKTLYFLLSGLSLLSSFKMGAPASAISWEWLRSPKAMGHDWKI